MLLTVWMVMKKDNTSPICAGEIVCRAPTVSREILSNNTAPRKSRRTASHRYEPTSAFPQGNGAEHTWITHVAQYTLSKLRAQ
jgi:hypothetical protein